MTIHILSPFAVNKNLGKAYNDSIKLLPADDWVCLMDYDAMFLLPEQITRMYEYVAAYPDTSLFVCYGSRCMDGLPQQWANGACEDERDILFHCDIAKGRLMANTSVRQIHRSVAGFLMLFSVAIWKQFPFPEERKCLTVDTNFSKRILQAKGKILLMESIYIWHTYRLMEGKKSIKHLL